MIKNNLKIILGIFIALAIISIISADSSFEVTSFSCSPSESVINSVFSCTASIQNTGDVSGVVNTATLYPDSNDWLEELTYPQSSGATVSAGQSTEVTFTGLRATKSGVFGFSKIMLDSVTDTYVQNNGIEVNIIDVAVSISNSASSAVMGVNVTTTAEVTAGGNIDVSLTFTSDSGGCSIGTQTNPHTINGMTEGSKQSKTWTITQGTSGNCVFTISASATGEEGEASKIDSSSSTITCTNCPVASPSTSTTSPGGGGSSGGVGTTIAVIEEITSISKVELGVETNIKFNFSNTEHWLSLTNLSNTEAIIIIESTPKTFKLTLGEEIYVDLNADSYAEISIKLDSINIITHKAKFTITKLTEKFSATKPLEEGVEEIEKKQDKKDIPETTEEKFKVKAIWWIVGIIVIVGLIALFFYIRHIKARKLRHKLYGY